MITHGKYLRFYFIFVSSIYIVGKNNMSYANYENVEI